MNRILQLAKRAGSALWRAYKWLAGHAVTFAVGLWSGLFLGAFVGSTKGGAEKLVEALARAV